MAQALWWIGFTVIGVWLDHFVPGVDFLAPGLIVCLQEDKPATAVWLGLAWMLLLEGSGSLGFGYGLVWYSGLALAYFGGCWLFQPKNFLFMALLGALAGLGHVGLAKAMAGLQDLLIDHERLAREGFVQAMCFPVVWFVTSKLYPERLKNAPSV